MDAEQDKLRLEVEKLRAEIVSLERSNGWWGAAERNVALLAALAAAASVGIGLYQFNQGQKADREQQQVESAREEAARIEELKKSYWQEQKSIYSQAALHAGLIASADSLREVAPEARQFWGMYWGPMSLLEHREVENAMVAFGEALTNWQKSGKKPSNIARLSYELAHCMKQSLAMTWRPVTGESVKDKACPY